MQPTRLRNKEIRTVWGSVLTRHPFSWSHPQCYRKTVVLTFYSGWWPQHSPPPKSNILWVLHSHTNSSVAPALISTSTVILHTLAPFHLLHPGSKPDQDWAHVREEKGEADGFWQPGANGRGTSVLREGEKLIPFLGTFGGKKGLLL